MKKRNGLENRILKVLLADETPRIDVDRDERFCFIHDEVADALEVNLSREGRFELARDAEAVEDAPLHLLAQIQLQLALLQHELQQDQALARIRIPRARIEMESQLAVRLQEREVAEAAAKERVQVRGTPITTELRDIIQFMVNSFVRPTYSELFALKHSDIAFRNDWLVLTIRRGKTGFRLTDTMPAAAGIYKRRLGKKTPNPDDYVFLPEYKNRKTAHRVISRQLNYLLDRAGLKRDKETGKVHSLYSLRHLSLAMRVLNSSGTADLLLLAQNAGTSHRMLELFYLNNLPRPEDDVRRLQKIKRSKEDITK